MFWYKWPSWVVELAAGVALVTAAQVSQTLWVQAYIATSLSWIYETSFDVNLGKPYHKPWKDLGQRQVGIVLGLLLWNLLV